MFTNKIVLHVLISIFILFSTLGCTEQNEKNGVVQKNDQDDLRHENVVDNKVSSANAPSSSINTAPRNASVPELSEEAAIKLIEEARDRNYKLLQKGGPCEDFTYVNTEDSGYGIICDEINSEEKIQSYLEEAFTPSIAQKIRNKLNLRYIGNELAFNPLDWGSMYDWGNIKVLESKKDGDQVTFFLKVGLLVASDEQKTVAIKLKYMDKVGWRVDTEPKYFL
ncbi:DL-endopeptidase inhibitor IseA family protein [Paenibacillus oleatilyticus]|uniref:DL-endopeptidase inhibitor IseA family protein n=1 Tax=Paenibacillus oleatilyticus TaxID=2594886 RepID=A0ABV4UY83_9BACL